MQDEHRPPLLSLDEEDEHLRCMTCGYDLTGVPEDRCPECGMPEARSRLRHWLNAISEPVPFGRISPSEAHCSLWWATLFRPSELGQKLPPYADERAIRNHVWKMRGISGLVIAAAFGVWGRLRPETLAIALLTMIAVLAGTICCETLTWNLLRHCAHGDRGPSPRLWRNLTRCFATFLPITIAFFLVGMNSRSFWRFISGFGIQWRTVPIYIAVVPMLAWWTNLMRAFFARTSPGPGRIVAVLAMPLIVIASFAFALMTIWMLMFACGRF